MITNKFNYVNMMKSDKKIDANIKEKVKLKEATQDFEAIFLKMMFDAMDKTVDREKSMFHGGNSEEIFRDMLSEERAQSMSKGKGVGISRMLYEQLSKSLDDKGKK